MNARQPISDTLKPAVLNLQFGDENQCFTAALENGFDVYTTVDCEVRGGRRVDNGIAICAMLGGSRYFGLSGGGKRSRYDSNTFVLWCQKTSKVLQSRDFAEPISRVYLNKEHTLIALHNNIVLQETPKNASIEPRVLAHHKTAENLFGLCCLGSQRMIFLGQSVGQIWVVDLNRDGRKTDNRIIPAHTSTLRALCMSKDEQLVATASEKGTIIRVFNTITAGKIAEFRRGVDAAIIFSLAFSPDNNLLAATSDKGTLHIFQIPEAGRIPVAEKQADQPRPSRGSTGKAQQRDSDWHTVERATPAKEGKWGSLANVPGAPRIFRDTYSSASCPFELGDDPRAWQAGPLGMRKAAVSVLAPQESHRVVNVPVPGWPNGRAPKGIIGWLDSYRVFVIGGGQDALWQRFEVHMGADNKLGVARLGWKRINRQ